MDCEALKSYMQACEDEMLATLEDLVSHESLSMEKAHLDRLALHLTTRWRRLGATAEIIENAERGNHVHVVFPAQTFALGGGSDGNYTAAMGGDPGRSWHCGGWGARRPRAYRGGVPARTRCVACGYPL